MKPASNLLIIIVNYRYDLEPLLDSIATNTPRGYSLIIMDNSVVNRGFAGAVNEAMKVDADFYLLLNPDSLVTPGYLPPLLDAFTEKDVGIVQPRMVRPNGLLDSTGHAWDGWEMKDRREEGPRELRSCCFGAVMIRGSLVREIGLLDPRFFLYYEDVDYCLRAGAAGWKVRYCPDSTVVHVRGGTGRSGAKYGWQSYGRLLKKWAGRRAYVKYRLRIILGVIVGLGNRDLEYARRKLWTLFHP